MGITAVKQSSTTMSTSQVALLSANRPALLGLGIENRAVGDFLHAHRVPFAVCDRSPALRESLEARWPDHVNAWRLGPDYLESLEDFDLLCRTPGLPYLHPALTRARQRGVACTSQTRLFLERCPAPVVGITGTKGKGTTATLTAAMLAPSDGAGGSVFLGGNIGRPPLSFLEGLQASDRVVLELSSFQTQDIETSPQVAVLLSITQDHLDHHADRHEYVEAKSALCRHQLSGDRLVFNADCPTATALARRSRAQLWPYGNGRPDRPGAWIDDGTLWLHRPDDQALALCTLDQIPLPGRHNAENAAAACAAAAACGQDTDRIVRALLGAQPLPHRLQPVAERAGVRYINDSLATTPDAAAAALDSFTAPVLLIAGGSSKGADFTVLARRAAERPPKAVFLIGSEAPRLQRAFEAAGYPVERLHRCSTLDEAVAAAADSARSGDVVLLSPACASFDMFAGYRERGERFTALAATAPAYQDR